MFEAIVLLGPSEIAAGLWGTDGGVCGVVESSGLVVEDVALEEDQRTAVREIAAAFSFHGKDSPEFGGADAELLGYGIEAGWGQGFLATDYTDYADAICVIRGSPFFKRAFRV